MYSNFQAKFGQNKYFFLPQNFILLLHWEYGALSRKDRKEETVKNLEREEQKKFRHPRNKCKSFFILGFGMY